jgi:hypothetical protein
MQSQFLTRSWCLHLHALSAAAVLRACCVRADVYGSWTSTGVLGSAASNNPEACCAHCDPALVLWFWDSSFI